MREYFIESRSRKLCVCELFLFYYVEYHSLLLCELLLIIFLFGEKRRQEVRNVFSVPIFLIHIGVYKFFFKMAFLVSPNILNILFTLFAQSSFAC